MALASQCLDLTHERKPDTFGLEMDRIGQDRVG